MKNILKKEITKADTEINRDQTIIKEYKQVNNYKIYVKLYSGVDSFSGYHYCYKILIHLFSMSILVFFILSYIIYSEIMFSFF